MKPKRGIALFVAASLATGVSAASLERLQRLGAHRESKHELLYLPNGRHLRWLSVGNASTAASLVYLWAIQYYSDYDRSDRGRYVEHVFGEVIGELDPHYIDPYWLGAMILSLEAGDLRGGLRLLDQGFARNPDAWVLPYLAGWECHRVGDFARASRYFETASTVPSAPGFVRRLKAGMVTQSGDLRAAIREWRSLLGDPASDATTREIADRQVRDLTVRADLRDLDVAIRAFSAAKGRRPASLHDLVRAGTLSQLPRDPDGRDYVYDARTGRASSSAGRILEPS